MNLLPIPCRQLNLLSSVYSTSNAEKEKDDTCGGKRYVMDAAMPTKANWQTIAQLPEAPFAATR